MDFINKFTHQGEQTQGQQTNTQIPQQQGTQAQTSGSDGFGSMLGQFTGGNQQAAQGTQASSSNQGGSFFSGLGNKMNSAAGGGVESEKNEDYLDKGISNWLNLPTLNLTNMSVLGIDFVQEKFMGGGKQDNESAIEQAKDEQISDFIRGKYKTTTGTDFPIKDKPTQWD